MWRKSLRAALVLVLSVKGRVLYDQSAEKSELRRWRHRPRPKFLIARACSPPDGSPRQVAVAARKKPVEQELELCHGGAGGWPLATGTMPEPRQLPPPRAAFPQAVLGVF